MRIVTVLAAVATVALATGWTLGPDSRESCELPPPEGGGGTVLVWLVRWDVPNAPVVPAERHVGANGTRAPLKAALLELFAGTTRREQLAGCGSSFSGDAGVIRSVVLRDGVATIDFRERAFRRELGIACCHMAGAVLARQVTRTAFQFATVRAVAFSFDGDCEAFGWFVESGRCVVLHRR